MTFPWLNSWFFENTKFDRYTEPRHPKSSDGSDTASKKRLLQKLSHQIYLQTSRKPNTVCSAGKFIVSADATVLEDWKLFAMWAVGLMCWPLRTSDSHNSVYYSAEACWFYWRRHNFLLACTDFLCVWIMFTNVHFHSVNIFISLYILT